MNARKGAAAVRVKLKKSQLGSQRSEVGENQSREGADESSPERSAGQAILRGAVLEGR
jgi:hypothetical protein